MDKDIELEILKVLTIVKKNQDLEEKKRFENNKEIVQVLKEMNNKIEKIKEFPPPKESENKIDNRFMFEAKHLEEKIENAGVSSFYLGKKGLAYVTDIRP